MKKPGHLSLTPAAPDVALLLLRLWLGVGLFLAHGYEKLTTFVQMAAHFPDPLHLGRTPSLVIALLADTAGALLVAAGLFTRLSAAYVVAWLLVWHASLLAVNGEVAYLYLGGYAALVLAGPGKYSLDYRRAQL